MLAKTEDSSRGNLIRQEYPCPEMVKIFAGMYSPDATLSIVADGKQHFFTLNRRQIMSLASEAFGALRDMEPGK